MKSAIVQPSSSAREACDRFLDVLGSWITRCIDSYADKTPTDIHDQLTYTTGWEPYLAYRRDPSILHFLSTMRDRTAAHYRDSGLWRHGYWREQEAHHGTEHFELFIGFLSRLDPDDPATKRQLVDAAEHMGNWSDAAPDWFDFSTGLFRSLFLGTDRVDEDAYQLNMPDHLRCANVLLLAHSGTADSRYLEFADAYAGRWAKAICADHKPLPAGLSIDGPISEISGQGEANYRAFAGMAGDLDDELDRAENILASGGLQLFLRLWETTGKVDFLHATQRLLGVLSGSVGDPDAGPVANAIRQYRRVTGNRDFDQCILDAVEQMNPGRVREIGLELPKILSERPAGVGKRTDMMAWYENGSPRQMNPILLSVAAEILDDWELAKCSVDLARTYFTLAAEHLPDGRHHGCAARTVSSVARGHGRDNHAGMTTAVLFPILQFTGYQEAH